eukprot:COSAG01_NODE_14281_length_1473_cov_1.474527_2_plen_84_part_00
MMLSGIDPNAGPRGDAYKATFDPSLFGRQLGEAAAARVGEQGQKPEEEEEEEEDADAELLGSFEAAQSGRRGCRGEGAETQQG